MRWRFPKQALQQALRNTTQIPSLQSLQGDSTQPSTWESPICREDKTSKAPKVPAAAGSPPFGRRVALNLPGAAHWTERQRRPRQPHPEQLGTQHLEVAAPRSSPPTDHRQPRGNLSKPDHVSRFLGPIKGSMPWPTAVQLGHEPLSLERDHRGAGCDQSVLEGGRRVPEPWARGIQPCSRSLACST